MPDIDDFIKELAPLELDYTDDEGNHRNLNSYIKRIYDDYIFISSPEKGNVSINIPDGQEIFIIFKTEKGYLSASSVVLGKQLDTMQGLKISFPHNSRFIERRAFVRIPFNLDVEITKILDSNSTKKETFNVMTNDISGSGLSYISEFPLDNYYDIHCKIHLADGEDPVDVRCEHISSRKENRNNQELNIISLAYIDISESQVSRIVKACFKYQIQNKKTGF